MYVFDILRMTAEASYKITLLIAIILYNVSYYISSELQFNPVYSIQEKKASGTGLGIDLLPNGLLINLSLCQQLRP